MRGSEFYCSKVRCSKFYNGKKLCTPGSKARNPESILRETETKRVGDTTPTSLHFLRSSPAPTTFGARSLPHPHLVLPCRLPCSALPPAGAARCACPQVPRFVMMSASKKERNLSMRFQSGQKSSANFCLFSKVQSASPPPGNTLVYLNVYDLTPVNGYVYWAGLGVFHSGIEVHGVEYAFGAHDYSISGIFEVEPRHCPGFKFRKSICMGTTCLDPLQVREFIEIQSVNYNGDTYHLISKNCNHFCQDICKRLTGNLIPEWVNRLARMGAVCNCILPESLKINAARHEPGCQAEDNEREMLTGYFSCFSSTSLCQRHFSASSLFLRSPMKGTWDTKQSNSTRLKKS